MSSSAVSVVNNVQYMIKNEDDLIQKTLLHGQSINASNLVIHASFHQMNNGYSKNGKGYQYINRPQIKQDRHNCNLYV